MRKSIPLKFISRLLLVVMLTVTINCVYESAHAMQCHVIVAGDHAAHHDAATPHQDQPPLEQHHENDCCQNCSNCSSHAPLTLQPLQLSYNPEATDLQIFEPFKFLPEVYLSKFIPPQIEA